METNYQLIDLFTSILLIGVLLHGWILSRRLKASPVTPEARKLAQAAKPARVAHLLALPLLAGLFIVLMTNGYPYSGTLGLIYVVEFIYIQVLAFKVRNF